MNTNHIFNIGLLSFHRINWFLIKLSKWKKNRFPNKSQRIKPSPKEHDEPNVVKDPKWKENNNIGSNEDGDKWVAKTSSDKVSPIENKDSSSPEVIKPVKDKNRGWDSWGKRKTYFDIYDDLSLELNYDEFQHEEEDDEYAIIKPINVNGGDSYDWEFPSMESSEEKNPWRPPPSSESDEDPSNFCCKSSEKGTNSQFPIFPQ